MKKNDTLDPCADQNHPMNLKLDSIGDLYETEAGCTDKCFLLVLGMLKVALVYLVYYVEINSELSRLPTLDYAGKSCEHFYWPDKENLNLRVCLEQCPSNETELCITEQVCFMSYKTSVYSLSCLPLEDKNNFLSQFSLLEVLKYSSWNLYSVDLGFLALIGLFLVQFLCVVLLKCSGKAYIGYFVGAFCSLGFLCLSYLFWAAWEMHSLGTNELIPVYLAVFSAHALAVYTISQRTQIKLGTQLLKFCLETLPKRFYFYWAVWGLMSSALIGGMYLVLYKALSLGTIEQVSDKQAPEGSVCVVEYGAYNACVLGSLAVFTLFCARFVVTFSGFWVSYFVQKTYFKGKTSFVRGVCRVLGHLGTVTKKSLVPSFRSFSCYSHSFMLMFRKTYTESSKHSYWLFKRNQKRVFDLAQRAKVFFFMVKVFSFVVPSSVLFGVVLATKLFSNWTAVLSSLLIGTQGVLFNSCVEESLNAFSFCIAVDEELNPLGNRNYSPELLGFLDSFNKSSQPSTPRLTQYSSVSIFYHDKDFLYVHEPRHSEPCTSPVVKFPSDQVLQVFNRSI